MRTDKTYRCKRCGEVLPMSEYHTIRLRWSGVCRLCELKAAVKAEEYARERRQEQQETYKRRGLYMYAAE